MNLYGTKHKGNTKGSLETYFFAGVALTLGHLGLCFVTLLSWMSHSFDTSKVEAC